MCEAGGIIAGEYINGQVQAGKVIFSANDIEYEGVFTSPTNISATFIDNNKKVTG